MASYAKFSIKERSKLKKYIIMKLGGPIITAEITDEQLDFCIDEALEVYSKWVHYDMDYFLLNVKDVIPITKENPNGNYDPDKGYKLPENIVAVSNIHEADYYWFQNQGTTAEFMFYNSGMFPTFNNTCYYGNGVFLDVYLAQNYLKQCQQMFGYKYNFNFNERSKFIKLDPDPQKRRQGKDCIILEVHTIREEDELLGEDYVKRLSVALAKQMVGQVRKKFGSGVSLPGGGQVDTEIYQEGKDEYDAIMEELKAYEPPFMFFLQQ